MGMYKILFNLSSPKLSRPLRRKVCERRGGEDLGYEVRRDGGWRDGCGGGMDGWGVAHEKCSFNLRVWAKILSEKDLDGCVNRTILITSNLRAKCSYERTKRDV
jgi:hypothetical protein